jgi:hypothetical protein
MLPEAVALEEPEGVVEGTVLIGRVVAVDEAAAIFGPDDERTEPICAEPASAKRLSITRARGATNSKATLRMSFTAFRVDEL